MNRPAPPRPRSLELFTGGILLFLLLSGALWSFASAAGQTLLLPILLAGCALLTVLLTLLCALPTRWMLAGMAALLAALLLLVWRLFPWLRLGEITYRCAVVNTVCTSLELDGFIRPIAQLPDAVWVRCATLLTLVASGALGTPLALAVVRRPSLPAAFLLTGPFVLAPLCISVTPDWMPLMGLLLGWIALGLGALVRRWDRAGAARLTLLSLPAAALLLALLGLAMPQLPAAPVGRRRSGCHQHLGVPPGPVPRPRKGSLRPWVGRLLYRRGRQDRAGRRRPPPLLRPDGAGGGHRAAGPHLPAGLLQRRV